MGPLRFAMVYMISGVAGNMVTGIKYSDFCHSVDFPIFSSVGSTKEGGRRILWCLVWSFRIIDAGFDS